MKKFIIIALLLFSTTTQGMCDHYGEIVDITSKTVAKVLNCVKIKEIKRDVSNLGHTLGLCNSFNNKGFICYAISKTAIYMIEKNIPEEWECQPEVAMDELDIILTRTCELLTNF